MKISVILSTYNWPDALNLALKSLARQTDRNFEVVVADDGSRDDTRTLIEAWRKKFPVSLAHSWQPDEGFRAARSRNKAVTLASGDYLILMDGDCFVRKDFVATHRALARPHRIVAGQRILLSDAFSRSCFETGKIDWMEDLGALRRLTREKSINRWQPALGLSLGPIRFLRPRRWQLFRTCNCSLFNEDFRAVGGQDEQFEGWGYEDSDMAIRLINNGCRMTWGLCSSPCFHLWHREADRSSKDANWDRLMETERSGRTQPGRPMQTHY